MRAPSPAEIACRQACAAYVETDDVIALHGELTAHGAMCTAPRLQPSGMREIIVTTPDGRGIIFAEQQRADQSNKG